ncbi:hypothetical protein H6G65_02600 [Microcystis elabens FACHB-917]|nr:hypothetical protein [Microcystis elabens FACHB-917]
MLAADLERSKDRDANFCDIPNYSRISLIKLVNSDWTVMIFRNIFLFLSSVMVFTAISNPAHAVLVKEGKASVDATKHCTKLAPGFWKVACFLLMADPPAAGISSISWGGTFDPNSFEIWPTPLYFGDFSESGTYIRLAPGMPGGLMPINEDPGIIEEDHYNPRTGAIPSFVVDNVNGSFSLTLDLSANPVPLGAQPQNFFGVFVRDKRGPIAGIEYFSEASADQTIAGWMNFSDVQCTGISTCGSDHPVSSLRVTNVPAVPAPLPILGLGAAFGYSHKLRKRIKVSKTESIRTTVV